MLIVRRSKLYYTASGIITPIGQSVFNVNFKTLSSLIKSTFVGV